MFKGFKIASLLALAAGLGLTLPMAAEAHRSWILPSTTQVDGKAPWITVDAATSEGLFDFDSFPLKFDSLTLTGPDGVVTPLTVPTPGHLRSTFDVQLSTPGTYRITASSASVMGSYTQEGQVKRFRGTEADLAALPEGIADLKVSRMSSRFETFVTSGKGNDTALQPTSEGLELVPVTHPSDLVVGETATFKFLLDGKPIAGLSVSIIPGGARFRNGLKDTAATTDAEGQFTVAWSMAGNYLITASYPPRPKAPEGEGAKGGADKAGGDKPHDGGPVAGGPGSGQGGGQGGGMDMPPRRDSYSATFEVLPN